MCNYIAKADIIVNISGSTTSWQAWWICYSTLKEVIWLFQYAFKVHPNGNSNTEYISHTQSTAQTLTNALTQHVNNYNTGCQGNEEADKCTVRSPGIDSAENECNAFQQGEVQPASMLKICIVLFQPPAMLCLKC